jgi:hypothetical protein
MFFKLHKNHGSAKREIQLSIERIRANIKFMNSNYDKFSEWILKNAPSNI